jgi:hypothetical protein
MARALCMMRRRVEADTHSTVVPAFRQEDIGVAFRFKASITALLVRQLDACIAKATRFCRPRMVRSSHGISCFERFLHANRCPLRSKTLQAKRNYFSPTHWTTQISLKWLAKLVLSRTYSATIGRHGKSASRANHFATSRDTPLIS